MRHPFPNRPARAAARTFPSPAGSGADAAAAPARTALAAAFLLLAWLAVPSPGARAVELAADAPETYTVQPGDTLWSVAGRFLRDPWRWREVWRENDMANPNLIYPGEVLRLGMVDGRPVVSRDGDGESFAGYRDGMRVVRLSPRVRAAALKQPVPTIPISSVAPFLSQAYIAESDEVRRAPYVVGFPDEHIVAATGDAVYARRIDERSPTSFQILRPGDALRDPDTNELLGYEAIYVADAELERTGDPAKLRVTLADREVSIGDRVIPAAAEESLANFYPRPAPAGLRGRIMSVLNGVSQVGRYDVVIVNKGSKDGVERGDVFEVYRGGDKRVDQVRSGGTDFAWKDESPLSKEFWFGHDAQFYRWRHSDPDANEPIPPTVSVRWPRNTYIAPYERSGVLMVFRTFDRVSLALVLEADRTMQIEDRIAPPPA